MHEEIIGRHGSALVRRLRLAPGEATGMRRWSAFIAP
jgi:hypothetical protein